MNMNLAEQKCVPLLVSTSSDVSEAKEVLSLRQGVAVKRFYV